MKWITYQAYIFNFNNFLFLFTVSIDFFSNLADKIKIILLHVVYKKNH